MNLTNKLYYTGDYPKISIPLMDQRSIEISRGSRVWRAERFKEKYEPKTETVLKAGIIEMVNNVYLRYH